MGSRLEKTSNAVRKRIENHNFDGEDGEEYEGSAFGGFGDYFRRKKIKLQNLDVELRAQSGDNPPIFRGVVAHVNGYTQPSLRDLHGLIVTHGGGFLQYLDGKTMATHIIASSLTPKKAVEFKKYRIVKPAWVVESVKAGILLPWSSFRAVDEGPGQKVIGFSTGKVINEASAQAKGYREQTDTSWYTEQLKGDQSSTSLTPKRFLPQSTAQASQIPVEQSNEGMLDISDPKTHEEHVSNRYDDENDDYEYDYDDDDALYEAPQYPPNIASDDIQPVGGIASVFESPQHHEVDGRNLKRPAEESAAEDTPKRAKLTAEEHNAILLADPRIRKSTVVDPGFLEQYYRESRLHHLSTWKADLKSRLQAMADERTDSQKQRKKRPPGARRYILHVDFDSFFAAVSLKKRPDLKDKPTVVAHGYGSGSEIASCNYPARTYGIKNGMWMKRAQELCPDLNILPYDFAAYEEISRAFYECIIETDGIVQSVSIEEALVDVSLLCFEAAGGDGINRGEGSLDREQEEADRIAQQLRDEIKEKTDCNVSVGIGGNILLAKVALRKAKPAGQYQIRPDDILDFVGNLQVRDLPGVAYSIGGKLEEIGVNLVKDVRELSKERLINTLGPKTGEKLWEYSRGIDRKEVGDVELRKSVSAEINWGVRFENQAQVDEFIQNLCGELNRRLLKEKVKGKHLTLKLMRRAADAPLDPPKHLGHGRCDTFNRSVVLGVATNATDILTKESLVMLKSFGFSPGELRGIGVQMTKLESLRAAGQTEQESSQRRLQFKAAEPSSKAQPVDVKDDPIEDFVTPKKPKATADRPSFGATHLNHDSPSRKPLNTLGTQFILPSQVDVQVLAELPEDIRSKLTRNTPQYMPEPETPSRKPLRDTLYKTSLPDILTAIPSESQLDPEVLEALPEDVRSEILSFHQSSPSRARTGNQTRLPHSPHSTRATAQSKKSTVAQPKRRGRPPKSEPRPLGSKSTLTQTNFVVSRMTNNDGNDGTATDTDTESVTKQSKDDETPEDIDADFLEALPEDIRREVLEEHRRQRLRKQSNLQFNSRRAQPATPMAAPIRNFLSLPQRPPQPTFTSQKLSALPQLRDAISDWVKEFKDEGPYKEDVAALGKFLSRVILEGDMNKSVGCVKWLSWVFEEQLLESEKEKWRDAVEELKNCVQQAVQERGLGRLVI